MKDVTEADIKTAAGKLGAFLLENQARIEKLLNIRCAPTADFAPKYDLEVARAFREAITGSDEKRFFKVSSDNSTHTIYPRTSMNIAFRFWHDLLHVTYNKAFTLKDELSVAAMHTADIKAQFGADSLEARIIDADTAGQSLYDSIHGGFPIRQDLFVIDYILRGASAALSGSYS